MPVFHGLNLVRTSELALMGVLAASGCGGGATSAASQLEATPSPTVLVFPGRSHPPIEVTEVVEVPNDAALAPPEDAKRASQLALSDPRVRSRLAGHRYAVLYVSVPPEPSSESKETEQQVLPEVIVFDYTSDRWLAIPVDLSSGTVQPFKERDPATDGQPPIVESEAREAVSLAMADPEVVQLTDRGFEPIERPVRVGRLGDVRCVTSRCVLVILYAEGLRRSALVQVDLGVQRVVGIYEE